MRLRDVRCKRGEGINRSCSNRSDHQPQQFGNPKLSRKIWKFSRKQVFVSENE